MTVSLGGLCLGEYLPKEALHESAFSVSVHLLLSFTYGSMPRLSYQQHANAMCITFPVSGLYT